MSDRLESMLEQLAKRLDETNAKMNSLGKSNGNGAPPVQLVAQAPSTATSRLEAMIAQLARRLDETNQRIEELSKKSEESKGGALFTPFDGLTICDGSKVKWFHAFENLQRKVHAFNDKLLDYLIWFNEERPHYALGLRSPMQFLAEEHQCSMYWRNTAGPGPLWRVI